MLELRRPRLRDRVAVPHQPQLGLERKPGAHCPATGVRLGAHWQHLAVALGEEVEAARRGDPVDGQVAAALAQRLEDGVAIARGVARHRRAAEDVRVQQGEGALVPHRPHYDRAEFAT